MRFYRNTLLRLLVDRMQGELRDDHPYWQTGRECLFMTRTKTRTMTDTSSTMEVTHRASLSFADISYSSLSTQPVPHTVCISLVSCPLSILRLR